MQLHRSHQLQLPGVDLPPPPPPAEAPGPMPDTFGAPWQVSPRLWESARLRCERSGGRLRLRLESDPHLQPLHQHQGPLPAHTHVRMGGRD